MSRKTGQLKKFEDELADLEQWLKLGLVPKKDIPKHQEEIEVLRLKIQDELDRAQFLKENGESEEYVPPKRAARAAYQEPQSVPDMPAANNDTEEESFDRNATSFESTANNTTEEATATAEAEAEETPEEGHSQIYDEDDDPFSDKNRWKRGILEDPDTDNW